MTDEEKKEYEKAINTIAKYFPCSSEEIRNIIETQIHYKMMYELSRREDENILELYTRIEELEKALKDERLKYSEEIKRKDKTIKRMAEFIKVNSDYPCLDKECEETDICCEDCIIEYFEKEEG